MMWPHGTNLPCRVINSSLKKNKKKFIIFQSLLSLFWVRGKWNISSRVREGKVTNESPNGIKSVLSSKLSMTHRYFFLLHSIPWKSHCLSHSIKGELHLGLFLKMKSSEWKMTNYINAFAWLGTSQVRKLMHNCRWNWNSKMCAITNLIFPPILTFWEK